MRSAGDFLNDYEGISSHEEFRGDLTLMYLPELDPDGRLLGMELWPMQIYRFMVSSLGRNSLRTPTASRSFAIDAEPLGHS